MLGYTAHLLRKQDKLFEANVRAMEKAEQKSFTDFQVVRETIESLAVAFFLALMFKAFIAEAFRDPTVRWHPR